MYVAAKKILHILANGSKEAVVNKDKFGYGALVSMFVEKARVQFTLWFFDKYGPSWGRFLG